LCQSFHQADWNDGWLRLAGNAEVIGSARPGEEFFADHATAHALLGAKDFTSRVHALLYGGKGGFVHL